MHLTTATLDSQTQPELTWRDGLAWLVSPMDSGEFFRRHWRAQRAVHIPAPASKIASFYSLAAHHHALTRIKPSHVRAAYGEDRPELPGLSLDDALAHFERGATICVTSLQTADDVLAQFCAILNRQFVSPDRFYCNSYYSPAGQGFGIHYDPQSVWIIQVEGRKRWRFSRVPVTEYPLEGTTGPRHLENGGVVPSLDELACVDLAPGDVLYLPPGTWHRGEALDGASFALSLSQPHEGVLPILQRVLATRFAGVEWHRHFPSALDGSAAIETQLVQTLGALHAITLEELRDAWSTLALVPQDDDRGDGRHVRLAQPLLTFDRGDALLIYARGKRYTLPSVCRTLFDTLAHKGELEHADAIALLDGDAELLEDLMQIGAVV